MICEHQKACDNSEQVNVQYRALTSPSKISSFKNNFFKPSFWWYSNCDNICIENLCLR